jgi:hypothetical protein
MKLPAHKGKFALLIIYVIVVFLAPFYTAFKYDPLKMVNAISKFVPAKDDQYFRDYFSMLKDQKVDQAYALLSPETQQSVTKADFAKVAKQFSTITTDMKVVGAKINYDQGASPYTTYGMTYEIANNDPVKKYMLVDVAARDLGQGTRIDNLQTYFETQSLTEGGKFAFPKPDWTLIVALLAPLFVVYTAYRYLTKAPNPRWWWLIGILFLSVYVSIRPGSVYGANLGFNGFMGLADLWGPWVYSPFLPLGAILYYFFRKKLESGTAAEPVHK